MCQDTRKLGKRAGMETQKCDVRKLARGALGNRMIRISS